MYIHIKGRLNIEALTLHSLSGAFSAATSYCTRNEAKVLDSKLTQATSLIIGLDGNVEILYLIKSKNQRTLESEGIQGSFLPNSFQASISPKTLFYRWESRSLKR